MRNPDKSLHATSGRTILGLPEIGLVLSESFEAPGDGAAGAVLAGWIFMARRLRDKAFAPGLFSDPAWDILLDLYAARAHGQRVQIMSLSPMSGLPPSTARRWAKKLIELGLAEREKDERDRRLSFLCLSEAGTRLMSDFFVSLLGRGGPGHRSEGNG